MEVEKWCRICSLEITCGVFIFGEEAKRSLLCAKIRRYLALSITLDDKLPKMVCKDCILKLDGFHRFATMALKNQEKMSNIVLPLSAENKPSSPIETKSLLHTYLTKGTAEKDTSNSEITEVEVRVDPMTILQCCLEDDDDEDEEAEVEEGRNSDGEEHNNQNYGTTEDISESSSENENCENTCIIYICTICEINFSSEYALQDHVHKHSSSHAKKILNTCNSTLENQNDSFVVRDRDPLIKHAKLTINEEIKQMDDSGYLFSCPICGKKIGSKENLRVHLETHRPKGKYGCDICGRVFKTQCNLYRHKEYHEGVQFSCEVCGRVYSTNSTLRAHLITHSDLRPHKCSLCDKTFKRNQDLKFHLNQHTGARPYQCPYCPKAFASSGNCFSHRKRMHPVEVERDKERAAKIMR